MKHLFLIQFLLIVIFTNCSENKDQTFSFKENDQGVELLEKGKPVFFYQKAPKSLDGKYICNNYIHPLYSLKGDTLTEEFPPDHPYHRGIFWAWHQLYLNGKSLGDGWIMENVAQNVTDIKTSSTHAQAVIKLITTWKSPFSEDKPFLKENTTITVHPLDKSIRKIDFAITLYALLPGLEIGGSDDEKGYGGFCARVKLPSDLTFTSSNGPVTPQTNQITAGPWMDISGSITGKEISGIAILCHPDSPNYPEPWILRSVTSMQNIVFPGRARIKLDTGNPVTLYYRLIVHSGGANDVNLGALQTEYNSEKVKNSN